MPSFFSLNEQSATSSAPHNPARYSFVVGCGGTGGHIYPGLALARELQSGGSDIHFIGNRGGMEERIVAEAGFPISTVHVQKLYRELKISNLLFPYRLATSVITAVRILRKINPSGVICTGGFVSGPVAIAAIVTRIPLYFHESNSFPGLTTRWLARFTNITFTSFARTSGYLPKAKTLQLGIPLLPKKDLQEEFSPAEIGLQPDKPVILITGGSQGSQAINAAVDAALDSLLEKGYQVIWQTGKSGYDNYGKRHGKKPGLHVFSFSSRLKEFYRCARIAVTRAGAMTIAELEQNRLPAILIPLPTAADNHQHHNAAEQSKKGVALLLRQSELNQSSLMAAIDTLESNYDSYIEKLHSIPANTATQDIVKAILTDQEALHAGQN
ncbi:MAG: UDP-N-acetylglucosamine--N-acetylmuramyl-(pentapeptide) pyrophosphoryl-undecaprenol N-acetylglucosamine transferase [Candidatus Cloacimonetes bacterium ADurb.Bin088]|jgi:UDP-N-acetylglucosamine--N-acetylmuramyl-(pentapeptide) pyrophosphoryl-undecaprenol N-acetylglucosamine transferase|nr:MAG: UDP-N-acetylglucosamine--N-acetylmuramyl-(pentapeptide) pyrophosphoryl-undecaprenol N-acetylglucosamine transferase [Candidatus Cloacimonetes bacterium ADurb.Bin088]